jgi:hypothetical protein
MLTVISLSLYLPGFEGDTFGTLCGYGLVLLASQLNFFPADFNARIRPFHMRARKG